MLFYYKNDKKVLNKVLYNIKITIFAAEIKSVFSVGGKRIFKHV